MRAVYALAPDHAAQRRRGAAQADQRRPPRPLRHPALARRAGRPVDDGQLHRDDPRHPPPRLWRDAVSVLLGISAGLDRADHRLGDADADRVQRLDPARRRRAVRRAGCSPAPTTFSASLTLLHVVPGLVLFGSLYFVFVLADPQANTGGSSAANGPAPPSSPRWWLATTRPAAGRAQPCSAATTSPMAASPA